MLRNAALALTLSTALFGALTAPGCVTPTQNREDSLVRIAREYNNGLRWGRYQDVTPHLAVAEAEKFLARTATLTDDFQMADHEVASIAFLDAGRRAEVAVDFTWYQQRRSLLRKTRIGQDWRFTEGQWLCTAQRRLQGDRFPLISEAAGGLAPASAAP